MLFTLDLLQDTSSAPVPGQDAQASTTFTNGALSSDNSYVRALHSSEALFEEKILSIATSSLVYEVVWIRNI